MTAEPGFALNKNHDIQEVIDAMDDKKLEQLCDFIKQEENRSNN